MDRTRGLGFEMGDGALGPKIDKITPSSGGILSGLLVTVEGYGFSGGNIAVGVGGSNALVTVVLSDNLMTFILPALGGLGAKQVQITTDLGTSNIVNFTATL